MSEKSRLEGRVALVTGATRGIGQAIALALGNAGATVVGTATSEDGAARITNALEAAGIAGCGVVLDVRDAARCEAVVEDVRGRYGDPLILVNNAGITRDTLLMRMKDDDWSAVLDTDLTSVYRLSKLALRGMTKARWGRIVNISSVVGVAGNPGQANYAAAKAGMIGFSKALAREVASRSVTVNCVAPGFIGTDMTGALTDEQKKALLTGVPLGRLGEPHEIAHAVLYLADAAYVTGTTLHVNGGMLMD